MTRTTPRIALFSILTFVIGIGISLCAEDPKGDKPDDSELDAALAAVAHFKGKQPIVGMGGPHIASNITVLVERWDNPRSEQMLKELSKGPHMLRGLRTFSGHANDALNQLRAKRQFHELMEGVNGNKKRATHIRKVLREHPEWMRPGDGLNEKEPLVKMLVKAVEDVEGGGAVDLIVDSGCFPLVSTDNYSSNLLDYSRQAGRKHVLETPRFLERIERTDTKDAVPLIRQWLSEEEDDSRAERLTRALARLPGTEGDLVGLLDDSRLSVLEFVAIRIGHAHPGKAITALERVVSMKEQEGADKGEITLLKGHIDALRKSQAGNENKK